MFRRIYITLFLLFGAMTLSAQELLFDGGISTHFDNTEYTGSDCGVSRTIFAVRVTPTFEYRWNNNHSVVLGAELLKDFGSKRFIDDAKFVAYYQFSNDKFGANAGIFERSRLIGRYSRAFYSDASLIYNNLVQGIAMRYDREQGKSFAELAVDWEGLYSPDTREQFRILAAAGGRFAKIGYAGVAMSVQHFANKSIFDGNVVDNVLINPYIGVRFDAFFAFDISLGYLQSMQRDRHLSAPWELPMGGELNVRISRWGVFIDNMLYVGKGLMPFYHNVGNDGLEYADNLYSGDSFYGTTHHIYKRTGIGYERSFAKDRVSVRAEMVFQYNGNKIYFQQLIGVSARICPTLYDKSKHEKK